MVYVCESCPAELPKKPKTTAKLALEEDEVALALDELRAALERRSLRMNGRSP